MLEGLGIWGGMYCSGSISLRFRRLLVRDRSLWLGLGYGFVFMSGDSFGKVREEQHGG